MELSTSFQFILPEVICFQPTVQSFLINWHRKISRRRVAMDELRVFEPVKTGLPSLGELGPSGHHALRQFHLVGRPLLALTQVAFDEGSAQHKGQIIGMIGAAKIGTCLRAFALEMYA